MHQLLHAAVVATVLFFHVNTATGKAALIVIDVQECFLPGGSLAVSKGDTIVPVINSIRNNNKFDMVIFSIDWHPPGHISFASTHQKPEGSSVQLQYLQNGKICLGGTITLNTFPTAVNCNSQSTKTVEQTLWADHCIQNVTSGPRSARLSSNLIRKNEDVFVYKGTRKEIDSYSAFFDNGNFFSTDLKDRLKDKEITKVFIVGFALDVCVYYTSMDAKKLGFDTYTVLDASLGINPDHIKSAEQNMKEAGITLLESMDIPAALNRSPKMSGPCLAVILVLSAVTGKLTSNFLFE